MLRNNKLFEGEGQGEGWVPCHVTQINERVIALYGRKNAPSAQNRVIFEVHFSGGTWSGGMEVVLHLTGQTRWL
jgi:hypothetical protein